MFNLPPIDPHTKRLSRHFFFMNLAVLYRTRGTCPRLRVGCILTHQNRIVAAGYNSSPPGQDHCDDVGCLIKNGHCIRCPHAEIAAIGHLEHKYTSLIAYVTAQPCYFCLRALSLAGAKDIYYIKAFIDKERDDLALSMGINLIQMPWPFKSCKDLLPFNVEPYSSKNAIRPDRPVAGATETGGAC